MSERSRKTVGATGLALGLVALMLIFMMDVVHTVGTDAELYHALQTDAGVLPGAGISDGDLRILDGELADYLAGRPNELVLPIESEPGTYSVLTMEIDGALQPVFDEREMAHLEDCLALFELLRKVRRRLIPWAILLITGGARLLCDRRRARRVALLSPLILLVPLGAYAVWAAVDFDGAFVFFHRVLFANDLWLLDPRTELLIRICPQGMFMAMARRIALLGMAVLVGVPALAIGLTFIRFPKRKRAENSWNDNRAMRRAAAQRPKTFDVGGKH